VGRLLLSPYHVNEFGGTDKGGRPGTGTRTTRRDGDAESRKRRTTAGSGQPGRREAQGNTVEGEGAMQLEVGGARRLRWEAGEASLPARQA
jgi:hypothetical protein